MSISPATSEVCSILDNQNHNNRQNLALKQPSQKPSSKKKNQRNRTHNLERSDLVLDWRAPTSTQNSKPLSADEDQNWRDHQKSPENGTWRTIKSKNRKIQSKSDLPSKSLKNNFK